MISKDFVTKTGDGFEHSYSLVQDGEKGVKVNTRHSLLLQAQSFEQDILTQSLRQKLRLPQLVGESPTFLALLRNIPQVAGSEVSVLITGETGTGKELYAQSIHYLSPRQHHPFIPADCGAIPVELVENELFGHVRGAFTDASTSQNGLLAEAEGGTLFLDEIDSLPLLAQVKLLRFLQEKEYRPLGSPKRRQANVRVIAATSGNLEEMVKEGKFRRDLYYRLNVISLALPPLRERREDIPLLIRHFLARYAAKSNKAGMEFSAEAMRALMGCEWPGNVRELEHVVERAIVLAEHPVIGTEDLCLPAAATMFSRLSFKEAKAKVIAQFERTYMQNLLFAYQGNISKAARAAGKNRRAFWQLMRKHKIDADRFGDNGLSLSK